MDAVPCFTLAINNSPMDTKNNCELEWFSKVFFSENKQQQNNWEKEILSLWMNPTPIKIYFYL